MAEIELDKIYNEDCLDGMKRIQDGSVDCIICDLPYNTTACDWDIMIPFEPLWEQYNRVLKKEGNILLFGSQPFTTQLIMSNPKDFRYEIIWVKNNSSNFQLAKKQPLKYHENICVFYKDIIQTEFSDIMKTNMEKLGLTQTDLSGLFLSKNNNKTGWVSNKLKGFQIPTESQWSELCKVFGIENEYDLLLSRCKKHTYNIDTMICNKIQSNKNKAGKLGHLSSKTNSYIQQECDYPQSVIYFDRESNLLHPTQKPVDLIRYLVRTYSNEGDTILDNCMGSGTTALACIKENRHFIGFELEKKYYDIAVQRIERERMQLRLF